MSMKGRFPIRRTLQYLGQGDVVFKDSVKVMTVNYNTHGELGEGARKFVFFNIPQIQYKNPWVQIMMFKNMTPTPFLRFYLDSGEQVLVDVETKSNKEIMEHIKKILGKSDCCRNWQLTSDWFNPILRTSHQKSPEFRGACRCPSQTRTRGQGTRQASALAEEALNSDLHDCATTLPLTARTDKLHLHSFPGI
ncbi:28S ribosomal protein S25, mitochondrial isoform X1 [Balaenoptera acutorostrata]|uniref:Small ribosomal subunit protein mS25 n=1 Tax=Balaenoptera acutorostrata TaxID=9767 RepID=A0ABM3UAS5_BALAC|nr:28S ribosomal protein S25, mitochondrial isoform X1 [Balaenoptera acutorostrata]